MWVLRGLVASKPLGLKVSPIAGNGTAAPAGGREGLVDQAGNFVLGDRPADNAGADQQGSGTSTTGATGEHGIDDVTPSKSANRERSYVASTFSDGYKQPKYLSFPLSLRHVVGCT